MLYYAFSISLSAFLLFQIQPIISKYILPLFGGTPAVWSAAILFFQVLLLAGYAYAYLLINRYNMQRQAVVHLLLSAFSAGLLLWTGRIWDSPVLPGIDWTYHNPDSPVWHIFSLLSVSIGLPFFILASNSTIVQSWSHRTIPHHSPYRFYALSNGGSLLALISYPFLVEPAFSLRTQGNIWSWGYGVFAIITGYITVKVMLSGSGEPAATSGDDEGMAYTQPTAGKHILWVAFTACASIMLLATTNQICQEVAVIPFLWVLPLTLYLLSFILCFSGRRWYSRRIYTLMLVAGSMFYCWVFFKGVETNIMYQIAVYSAVLFICSMICHGELVRLKPDPRYLHSFYLMVALGGALGGITVTLIAPLIFKGYWELHGGLVMTWLLLGAVAAVKKSGQGTRLISLIKISACTGAGAVLVIIFYLHIQMNFENALKSSRNFYGILQVKENSPDNPEMRIYFLKHGATTHGFQYREKERSRKPTSYFTEESGVGLAIQHHPRRQNGLRIGVIGLGIGTIAAYGRPVDTLRFYEINPDVIKLARGEGGYFSYLRDSLARIDIVPGDARISMQRELEEHRGQQFDVLVLDAFNSDSIPVHLLNREAFEIYLRHLRPDGIIAFHISNRHLDLKPVIWKLDDFFHMDTVRIESKSNGDRYASTWMLATNNREFLDLEVIKTRSSPREGFSNEFPLWTDDYSNLFQILR